MILDAASCMFLSINNDLLDSKFEIFSFLWAGPRGRSRTALSISRSMLTRLLTYHQVMPEFLDFVSVFGNQDEPRGLKFSGFRQQCMIFNPPRLAHIPHLGRSGRQYQICYNLRAVVQKINKLDPLNPASNTWYPQQAAFHHQFDVCTGSSLWISAKGNLDIQGRLQKCTSGRDMLRLHSSEESFLASLEIHLVHCRWATEGWNWCLQWLEDVIDKQVSNFGFRSSKR
jgi:hypothetical protein